MEIESSFFEGYSIGFLVGISLLTVFLMMGFFLWVGWLLSKKRVIVLSPYTKTPVRRFRDLSYISIAKVRNFMLEHENFENQMFKINRALVCRDTGRIFVNTISWYGKAKLDWTFLQKRYPGNYVSWGSLSDAQQRYIQEYHETLEGYQTEFSSPSQLPQNVEPEYVYAKPGPLYVNIETKELLGWMCVPESELEVLIVQKPKDTSGIPKYQEEEQKIENEENK